MNVSRKKNKQEAPRRRQGATSTHERATKEDLNKRYTFRRNRTLTGSVSSQISASGELNAELQSPRVHAHHLTFKRRRIGLALSMVTVMAIGVYMLIVQFTAFFSITVADMPEHKTVAENRYEPLIREYYTNNPFERLGFFFDETQFMAHMQEDASEIAHIEVSRSLVSPANTTFNVAVRKPIVSWSVKGTQLFVDGEGVAFVENYYEEPDVRIVDRSGVPASEDGAIASNRFLGFVGRTVEFAQKRGYKVEQVIIPENMTRQVDLKVRGVAYTIKCSIDRPAGEQVEDIDNAIKFLKDRNQSPGYVDVRVSGRAYYK